MKRTVKLVFYELYRVCVAPQEQLYLRCPSICQTPSAAFSGALTEIPQSTHSISNLLPASNFIGGHSSLQQRQQQPPRRQKLSYHLRVII